ncbi:unnamed protein product [Caenorhabditis angaria]|uniref:Uncharacterized protein n=1 Tax=Caenorhabditis angaria TaxID=860376 RepID=A0A9P1I514_9PELO|nr:unnamed protein product [Caenorhabditis angaria]
MVFYLQLEYVPPKSSAEVEAWIGLDIDRNNLKVDLVKEELDKQHCLIDVLHSKIIENHDRGFETNDLDSQLWQVQNNITTLKRRVKTLNEGQSGSCVNSRCIEIYEEKQLMATQGMLKEDIRDEKRNISEMCWKIEKNFSESEKLSEKDQKEEEMWKEKCVLEEAARSSLVEEISKLRSSCASLRARLEMISTEI